MGFWIWIDDAFVPAELAVGACVAAIAALVVDIAQSQAASHIRIRGAWLRNVVTLPGQVIRDSWIVFAALWQTIRTGRQPNSGFREIRSRWGDDTAEDQTRRTLWIAATSIAPNTFALGLDHERNIAVVHHLVVPPDHQEGPGDQKKEPENR
jgi:multisubunit Na+/H+ antiporter MnhE subunit